MSTGRKRTKPAFNAALRASPTRIFQLLAGEADDQDGVGGGHAHAHDGAGEGGHAEPGVGEEEEPDDAGDGRGQGGDDQERIQPGLEVDHDEEVDQQDGERQTGEQADVGLDHGLALAAENDLRAAGEIALDVLAMMALICAGDGAEVGAVDVGVDVEHGLDVVVADGAELGAGSDGGQVAEHLHRTAGCRARRSSSLPEIVGLRADAAVASHGYRQALQLGQRLGCCIAATARRCCRRRRFCGSR